MAEDASRENRSMTASRKEEELADIENKTKELVNWITGSLKIKLAKPNNFRESLLDGVVLCQIANSLKPNSVKRYHKKPRMLMMKMENIGARPPCAVVVTSCPMSIFVLAAMLLPRPSLPPSKNVIFNYVVTFGV